jgi:PAS domain S-box-containing protein
MVSALLVGRGPEILTLMLLSVFALMFSQPGLHISRSGSTYLQLTAFIVASTVITEVIVRKRRLAAHGMQANAERHAFADSCPDGFLMMDTELTIEFANQAVTKMFGYAVDEVIGKTASLLLPEFGHAQSTAREFAALRKGGEVFTVETRCGRMASTTTLFIRDITERKRAQKELENSRENMRLILETVPGLLFSRLPSGEVEYANQRSSEYLGMTQEEINSGAWVNALHPNEKQEVLDEIVRNFAKGEPYTMEYRRRRYDGVYRRFQTSVQPLKNEKGEIIRWYGILTDVDDLRRAEESLRLTQEKLSHAMQIGVLSEFAASVVHEISQPLTAMVADGEACRLWLSLNSPNVADIRAAIERIVGDGEEVRTIIGTLRDLFRRSPAQKVVVNLCQVANEVITLARSRASNQQVAIDSQMPDDLPAVMADRIQVQQVLMNLLLNAMDSLQTVSLDRKRIVIRARRHGEMVVTEIEDRGSGVEDRERIFESFFTTKGRGMGMGLSICRSIIEAHEGQLWCEPGEVWGTVFSFTLPLSQEGAD